MRDASGPGPAPVPVERVLRRLRWWLTVWFTLVLGVGVVVLVATVAAAGAPAYGSAADGLAGLLAVLGVVAVAVFGPGTWVLLGYVLAPVTRTLNAQESFLRTAAHDLRTPLATLGALLDTARRDPAERDTALDRAARLVDRSGDIVEDLLLRARLAAGTLPVQTRPARLDQVVEAVLADLAGVETMPVTGPDGAVTTEVDVDGHRITMVAVPTIAAIDPALAERAVANLVHNALRHGREPGTPASVAVTVEPGGDRAYVTIADSGPGLRPPVVRTGLGLSVVRWVARVHGGALLLGTGPQPGTRIRLAFPTRPR